MVQIVLLQMNRLPSKNMYISIYVLHSANMTGIFDEFDDLLTKFYLSNFNNIQPLHQNFTNHKFGIYGFVKIFPHQIITLYGMFVPVLAG